MDPRNVPLPSIEPDEAEELQSPHSPTSPTRSATYSPDVDRRGVPDRSGQADTAMGGQSGVHRQQNGYVPFYSAPQSPDFSAQTNGRGEYEFDSPQSPVDNSYSPYSGAPGQYWDGAHYQNGYSPQSPFQSQPAPAPPFSPSSPADPYSQAHSPNVASPAPTYLSNFMNLSPTQHASQAYSPDAYSPQINGYDRSFSPQGSFQERNDYASVRAPESSSRSPLGPHGASAAVSVSDFDGYPQADPNDPNQHALLRIHKPLPNRSRRNLDLEFSASAPVAELGPGSDPPPLASQRVPWNNKEKYTDANYPDRFEQFILSDGEKKCVGKPDTRTPNSAIFTFNKEDHTLGNLLKCQLLKDKRVLFSGYKVAHPLVPNFELRIQTDGTVTPKEALVGCCRAIVVDLDTLSREFTKEFELRKIVAGDPKD